MLRFLFCAVIASASLISEEQAPTAVFHRIKNCEIELEMLKNSISTQEQAREALEKEVSSLLKATRESVKETCEGSSHKQAQMEKAIDKLVQDCKQLKTHSNELSSTVNELGQSIHTLRETTKQQGQAIKELEHAMRALTLAVGGKSPTKSSAKTSYYTVKSGDSLEKIARAHNMTIAELKELNDLKNSTIRPGKELRVRQP